MDNANKVRDVFISYHVSPGTSALVRDIADELESMGISCWYAPRNVTPGAFVPSILDAIACCKAFLMILDEGANGPGYVYNEMLRAFDRYKWEQQPEIIPFKLGTFTTDPNTAFYLAPFHILDGGASAETAHTEELIRKISGFFHKSSEKQLNRETQPAPKFAPSRIQTQPVKIIQRDECGDDIIFTLDENGVLTIFGKGPMWGFKRNSFIFDNYTSDTPWWNKRNTIVHVEIQQGVTEIGEHAFDYCEKMVSITIPDSVTTIRDSAFFCCAGLTSVTIPNSVTTIGRGTFCRCKKLTNVTIPHSVTTIGNSVFVKCVGLKSITIPDSVKEIGGYAFQKCVGLKKITIPNSVITIGEYAFVDCKGLKSVTIPDSVIKIEEQAFGGCNGLTSVSIPANARIGWRAFPRSVRITRRE